MLETIAEIKAAAVRLLARREHSRRELEQKLTARADEGPLAQALDALEQDGYLSDARFAASYIRSKAAQGFGPRRIQFDLQRKGITDDLWRLALEEEPVDWFVQARTLAQRRFTTAAAVDRQAYAKQMRYLLGRGYSADQARYALDGNAVE